MSPTVPNSRPAAPTRSTRAGGVGPTPLRRGLTAALAGFLAAAPAALPAENPAPPTPPPAAPATSPAATPTPVPGAASTNDPQSRLVLELLERIRELERRDAERAAAAAAQSKPDELVRQLQNRITELENKVHTLENGRVLPEIAVTPDDGPSAAELDQKLRILERKEELAAEAAAARAKESPQLAIGPSGFSFASADTNFVLKVRGVVQLDSRTFFDDHPLSEGNDGFVLRRARPIIEGTVFRDFDFQFVPDFGGNTTQIFDANIAYRLRPEIRFRAGKFKGPVGQEHLLGDSALAFNERSLVSDLVPSRNLGFQAEGEAFDGVLGYAAGLYNGTGDGRVSGNTAFGDDPEFGGRLVVQPFKRDAENWFHGLAVSVGGSYSQTVSNALALPNTTGGTRPGYTTTSLQQFFAYNSPAGTVVADGTHWRLSPGAQFVRGPFGLLGEYILTSQGVLNSTTLRRADLEHSAWQVAAQWVLTGEAASFNGITPLRPFRPLDGDWGAWQLVARYSQLDLDADSFQGFANPATSARGANTWGVGINWWLNRNARVLTSFSLTTFDGGGTVNPADPSSQVPPATVTHQDEKALLTRLQLAF